jgi:hypothetical protein
MDRAFENTHSRYFMGRHLWPGENFQALFISHKARKTAMIEKKKSESYGVCPKSLHAD